MTKLKIACIGAGYVVSLGCALCQFEFSRHVLRG